MYELLDVPGSSPDRSTLRQLAVEKKLFVLPLPMLAVRKDLRKSFRLSQFKRIATTCNRLIATVSNTLLHDIYEGTK